MPAVSVGESPIRQDETHHYPNPVVGLQSREQTAQVDTHGVRRNSEPLCDLAVRAAPTDQPGSLYLSRWQTQVFGKLPPTLFAEQLGQVAARVNS